MAEFITSQRMRVSVIIPTYNGAKKLPQVLHALSKQTVCDFEVIVAIDGSTDNSDEIAQDYAKKFVSFRIIFQKNSGRAAIRNFGAVHASGELFIFYDDDMVPFPDSVERHVAFHQSHLGLCGGSQFEVFDPNRSDVHNYKAHLSERWLKNYSDGIAKLTEENLFFTAANCSLTKGDFNQLNGFDNRLSDGEDYDLACRALEAGMAVYFDRSNKAFHGDSITAKSYIIRLRQYRLAHEQIRQLHPTRKIANYTIQNWKRWFYKWFTSNYWITLMDQGSLKFLPRFIRFKIYDWIIQARAVEFPDSKLS